MEIDCYFDPSNSLDQNIDDAIYQGLILTFGERYNEDYIVYYQYFQL